MEDIFPDPSGRPADESIVERLVRTVGRRGVDPAATALQHMNDPADDTAIINPWFATCVARKMRLKPCKLLVAKPESVSIHQWSPFGDLETPCP
jgi:hypothetical protein